MHDPFLHLFFEKVVFNRFQPGQFRYHLVQTRLKIDGVIDEEYPIKEERTVIPWKPTVKALSYFLLHVRLGITRIEGDSGTLANSLGSVVAQQRQFLAKGEKGEEDKGENHWLRRIFGDELSDFIEVRRQRNHYTVMWISDRIRPQHIHIYLTPDLDQEIGEDGIREIFENIENFECHNTGGNAEKSFDLKSPVQKDFFSSEINHTIEAYCSDLQQHLSTIHLFGSSQQPPGENQPGLKRIAPIVHGFLKIQLSEWSDAADKTKTKPLNIDELFFDYIAERNHPPYFLIRGLPGSGKTTLMRYLGYHFAGEPGRIPVYLRLRHFNFQKSTLEKYIRQQIDKNSRDVNMRDTIWGKHCFLETPMVLLLDGLDEIEDSATHDKIAELLDEFVRDHPRCTVIVTSRPLGLNKKDYRQFRCLNLIPLNEDMVKDYLDRWFADDSGSIEKLRRIFRNKPRIRNLTTNPFLLSLICYTFEHGGHTELIERRSQLYQNCTEYLIKRLYDGKEREDSQKEYEQTLQFLKDLSLRFFLWQEAVFPTDYINVIAQHHPRTKESSEPRELLEHVLERTGMVQPVEDGYTFIHRSLWEYFTALALKNKELNAVVRHAANPQWEEVIRLYAGLLPDIDAVKALVSALWTINRPLALRVMTEVEFSPTRIIKPLLDQEKDNHIKLQVIDSLKQSFSLIPLNDRSNLIQETLRILLLDCREWDCEVIYHAHRMLEGIGMNPLKPGGLIYDLLDLAHAAERQRKYLADIANYFAWIQIPKGRFQMGDGSDEDNPAHEVTFDAFLMAKHPVTNRFMAQFPFGEKHKYGGDAHPAADVSWWEAYYFALWVDARLPTEAEWEYAAGGGKEPRNFGDEIEDLVKHAWFGEENGSCAHAVNEVNPNTGQENLNPLGLANMHGNVMEWCADWYNENYYKNSPEVSPQGPKKGSERVLRGGCWFNPGIRCRTVFRNHVAPDYRHDGFVGFRLVKDVPSRP